MLAMTSSSTSATTRARGKGHEIFPFLNHSPSTLPNNLPPCVDDKPLARQRRKRTCPLDQAVLEESFQRDPKPDKSARLEIVARVSLGEKEVQIWFQNRRQSSRRKSRPLLPHEIAQYHSSRAAALISEPHSHATIVSSSMDTGSRSGEDIDTTDRFTTSRRASAENGSMAHFELSEGAEQISQTPIADVSTHESLPTTECHPNRCISHFERSQVEAADSILSTVADQAGQSGKSEKKGNNHVRLSLSASGKAEIITKDISSPSPPRPNQVSRLGIGSHRVKPVMPVKALERSISGRSRDARSWEFWCDKESRTEFESTAEKDASGSAAGAIGLLRSASGRSILGAIRYKRNVLPTVQNASVKRVKLDQKRLPLQRSQTSLGRLQNASNHAKILQYEEPSQLKRSGSASYKYVPGDDSNKENVSPRCDGSGIETPYLQGDQSLAPAMQSNQSMSDASFNERPPRLFTPRMSTEPRGDEESDPEADPELVAFMQGENRSTDASEGDDMDCIHGLLSLSQGNWK